MANKTDGDPNKKGGAYAPKGRKHPAGPKIPVDRKRPRGGWVTSPVVSGRHGRAGSIALARRMKQIKAAA